MAQYMGPLIRSGALWSCGRNAAAKPRRGLWSRIWNWFGVSRPTSLTPLQFRSDMFRPGKPRY